MANIMSDRALVTLRMLSRYLRRYPENPKSFSCFGKHDSFIEEFDMFTNCMGWKYLPIENIKKANVGCLFFTVDKNCTSRRDVLSLLSRYELPIILACIEKVKKTPVHAVLENLGYRLLFEINKFSYFYKPEIYQTIVADNLVLGSDVVQNILSSSLRKVKDVPLQTHTNHVLMNAHDLLVPKRFDIAMKHLYARLTLLNVSKVWREYVYFQQAVRITGGGRDLREYDGTGKEGEVAFIEGFNALLEDIDPIDISPVPIDRNLVAYDGSHRIAAAIAKNRYINCVKIDDEAQNCADSGFFKSIISGHLPCPDVVMDEAAIEYCRIKDSVAIALVFPTVLNEESAIEALAHIGDVVYRKDIRLSPEAGGELLRQVYLGQPWLHSSGQSDGFLHKLKSCFPYYGELRVLLVDGFDQSILRKTKEGIRDVYGIGNHSIHITDTWDETLLAARTLFNAEGLKVLSMGVGAKDYFLRRLFQYRDWLDYYGLDHEHFCIGGSALLGLMGLRDCNDLDFLFIGDIDCLPERPEKIDCHNETSGEYYSLAVEDMIVDPRHHFWYMGIKFCSPEVIINMKNRRNLPKDKLDVILLKSRISSQKNKLILGGVFSWTFHGYVWVRLCHYKAIKMIKNILRPLVKRFYR